MSKIKKSLSYREDIELFVNEFYKKIQQDDLLAPIFSKRIPNKQSWKEHLETMYNFWESILFFKPKYRGFPFPKHIGLDIDSTHFDRWIGLFCSTIDEYFIGEMASKAKEKAKKIRIVFETRLGITTN